jgi:Integrase/Phage integrase, N-terminal
MHRHQSITAKFMTAALAKKRGGRGTRERMHSTFKQVERIAKLLRWGAISPASITHRQLKNYVAQRLTERISAHSIQTEISAIRRAIDGAGRHLDVLHLFTSESLGVPAVSRKGNGIAMSDATYEAALASAGPGTIALMYLQRDLGLRINECIECKDSLPHWETALRHGATHVHLMHGSKGGRPRDISILPQNAEAAYRAVVAALAVTNGGKNYPVDAKNGKHAARVYSQNLAAVGIKGEESSHSMRRRFACNQYGWYGELGYSRESALARLSMDLGHGDGRGRWVYNNYLRNSIQEEPDE